jgi:hypothetical protein
MKKIKKENTKLKAYKSQLDKFKEACQDKDVKEEIIVKVIKRVSKVEKK